METGNDMIVGIGPKLMDDPISQFTCYAAGGMGYAFWMRVAYKNKGKGESWHKSGRGPSVTVWTMKSMNLRDVAGLEEGAEVRLIIEVKGAVLLDVWAGAEHSFIYKEDANLSAYHEATGAVSDADVSFKKYRDPE